MKPQLVTIYDLKITTIWEGTLADGTRIRGLLTAVEVGHDMDEEEYVFENTFEDPATFNSNSEAQALKTDASKKLADGLRSKFQAMPKAMIAEHGKDLLAQAENDAANGGSGAASPSTSGAATPITATSNATTGSSASGTKNVTASTASKASAKKISTARITRQEDFMIVSLDGMVVISWRKPGQL